MSPLEALTAGLKSLGSQAALARICGVSQNAVWKWVHTAKSLPAEHVLKVEAATGVSRHDLRPDLYPREGVITHVVAPAPIADHGKTSANLDSGARHDA